MSTDTYQNGLNAIQQFPHNGFSTASSLSERSDAGREEAKCMIADSQCKLVLLNELNIVLHCCGR